MPSIAAIFALNVVAPLKKVKIHFVVNPKFATFRIDLFSWELKVLSAIIRGF